MNQTYLLKNAIIFNPTGKKYNAIASPATLLEIEQHKEYYNFDFAKITKEFFVYKLCKEGDDAVIHGLVAFKPSLGILACANMEANIINLKPLLLHGGIGKSLIALCCKMSFDLGFDGYITFEAKNSLMPYYKRFGAENIGGLRMAIATKEALKLVNFYF